jgi:hypothetical protein
MGNIHDTRSPHYNSSPFVNQTSLRQGVFKISSESWSSVSIACVSSSRASRASLRFSLGMAGHLSFPWHGCASLGIASLRISPCIAGHLGAVVNTFL